MGRDNINVKIGWFRRSGIVIDLFETSCKLPRAIGVYPFITNRHRIEVSKILVTYNASIIVCLLVLDYFILKEWNSLLTSDSSAFVTLFIRTAQLIMSIGTIAVSSFWILRNKMNIQELINELQKFEDIVQPKALCLCNRWLYAILATLPILAILNYILDNSSELTLRILVSVRFHLGSVMIFSTTGFFTRCTMIIGNAYEVLTKQLNDLESTLSTNDILKAAEHLVSGSEALNKIFGPQMLCLTSASFVLITGNAYLAINSPDNSLTIICIVWILTFTELMLHLISSCDSVVNKAVELDKALYRILLEGKNSDLTREVRSSLHYTNNRKVEFTACGFFTMNYSLAGSMVASATTYLVILIQIGNTDKPLEV